jgi:hypothetical protein
MAIIDWVKEEELVRRVKDPLEQVAALMDKGYLIVSSIIHTPEVRINKVLFAKSFFLHSAFY